MKRKQFGTLLNEKVYTDTEQTPGEILYSNTIPLMGKPDYLVKEGEELIPVELKTGKTPTEPWENHVMQLMAYCYLVEENYGVRPKGGIVKYPEREFKLLYTDEAKQGVINTVLEIMQAKESEQEYACTHPNHNQKT